MQNFISTKEALPPQNPNNSEVSFAVEAYSPKWGFKVGTYNYATGYWTVEGVSDRIGVTMDFWRHINTSGKAIKKDADYWQKRCLAAEKFIDLSPNDPDVYPDQFTAYKEWQNIVNQ